MLEIQKLITMTEEEFTSVGTFTESHVIRRGTKLAMSSSEFSSDRINMI